MNREPLSLLVFAENRLPEYINFEPEIIQEGLNLNDIELSKLLACKTVNHNFYPFTHWHIFEKTVVAFNDRRVNPQLTQDITPAEITYAVKCMRTIDKVTNFSDEVFAYIATIFHHDGLLLIPKTFNNEETDNGHSLKFFMDQVNNGAKLDETNKESQEGMLESINHYVTSRIDKSNEEIRKDNLTNGD
jgi:hypothetical protein